MRAAPVFAWSLGLLVAFGAALPGRAARADILQLKDGRFIDGSKDGGRDREDAVKMEKSDAGVVLHFKNGDVLVPKELVKDVLIEGAGGFEGYTEEDKAQLDKGLVPYNGKWVPKAERDRLVAKKVAEQRKKIEDAKAHREWRNRYKTESKHFQFEYTLPPENFEPLRDLLEAYYETFTKKWKIRPDIRIGKPPVCLYHDPEYYYQVTGMPRGAIGYFRFVKPIELNLYYDRNDPRLTLDVLFHEGNHLLTHMIDPTFHYPAWVNESLAEYYGASQYDPATKTMSVGHVQEGRLVVLWDQIAGKKWLGLEEMIKIERFDAIDYAWGWSFVHFLMETPKYSEKFQDFYIALAKDQKLRRQPIEGLPGFFEVPVNDQIQAFRRYMGVKDLKALEKEWHEYIQKSLKLESGRGYAEAGQWAWRWDMKIKAKRFLQMAVDGGSTDPTTYKTFAKVLVAHGDYEGAGKMWERAIELDPLDATTYADYARSLLSRPDEPSKERGKKMLALANDIDPNDPYVWLQLELQKKDDEPPDPPPAMEGE